MPRLESADELRKLREAAQQNLEVRVATGTRIIIGMATCGIAAGAQETKEAIVKELEKLLLIPNTSQF